MIIILRHKKLKMRNSKTRLFKTKVYKKKIKKARMESTLPATMDKIKIAKINFSLITPFITMNNKF